MTYLILFYAVLTIIGGTVLYAVNSHARKKKEKKRRERLPETKPAAPQNKSAVSSPGSSDVISDAEYREVLRKGLKAQTAIKEQPAEDPLKYSDEKYREVLRTMHKQLRQNKEDK